MLPSLLLITLYAMILAAGLNWSRKTKPVPRQYNTGPKVRKQIAREREGQRN